MAGWYNDRISWLWLGWLMASGAVLLLLRLVGTRGIFGAVVQVSAIGLLMMGERLGVWSHHEFLAKLSIGVTFALAIMLFKRREEISPLGAVGAAMAGVAVLARMPLSWAISIAFLLGWGNLASQLHSRNASTESASVRRDLTDLMPALTALATALIVYPREPLTTIVVFAPLSFVLNDVFASEFGPFLPSQARLLPRFSAVPHGTPGAVSPVGTMMGLVGSAFAALGAYAYAGLRSAMAVLIAGQVAAFLDTCLQRGHWFARMARRNEIVNFVSALTATLLGVVIACSR